MDGFDDSTIRFRILINFLLLILLATIWGSQFVVVKIGLASLPPLLFAAVRFDVAAVILGSYIVSRGYRINPRHPIESMEVISSGLLIFVLSQGLYHIGQLHVSSGVAAILYSTIPLLVSGFSLALLSHSQRFYTKFGGICIGFVGVWIIVRPEIGGTGSLRFFGRSLILGSSAAFAIATVWSKKLLGDVRLSVLSRLWWAMLIGSIGLHGLSFAFEGAPVRFTNISAIEALPILYLAIVPSIIAYVIFYRLLDRIGPLEVSLVTYLVPVCTAILGWIVLNEHLSGSAVVGFLMVSFGFIVVKWPDVSEAMGLS